LESRAQEPRSAAGPPDTTANAIRCNTQQSREKKTPDSEGRKRIVRHVSYERSQNKRTRAIKIHGTICGFDFDEFYGRVYADGHIHIHHIKVLSEH
jgi:predicted HNH restriction endonuclease